MPAVDSQLSFTQNHFFGGSITLEPVGAVDGVHHQGAQFFGVYMNAESNGLALPGVYLYDNGAVQQTSSRISTSVLKPTRPAVSATFT